jgi:mono/diheme cytochrome c family protein
MSGITISCKFLASICTACLVFYLFSGCNEAKKGDEKKNKSVSEVDSNPIVQIETLTLPEYMTEGEKVYAQNCLVCHQAGGSGVSGLNPPLKDTDYVTGDTGRLLGIILNGSNEGLVVNGSTYSNAMPGFAWLTDREIANVASYIRNSFGNSASPVSSEEVSALRPAPGQ